MAIFNVAGTAIGAFIGTPAGLAAATTPAQIIAAYEAETYTSQSDCKMTGLPVVTRDWDTAQEPITVCADSANNDLRRSFKTNRVAPNATVTALMDYADPFIQMMYTAQESGVDVITYQITHPNGTDKIWAQVQVKSFTVDMTDLQSRTIWSSEWFYESWPVFSALM